MALPPELQVFLLASLPLTELQAALPLGITVFGLSPATAYVCAVLGNMLPIPFVFLVLMPLMKRAEVHPRTRPYVEKYFHYLKHKHEQAFNRYGSLAILTFGLIPLPGTGAWTASILAVLFGLPPRYAIPSIIASVLIAGVVIIGVLTGVLAGWEWLIR